MRRLRWLNRRGRKVDPFADSTTHHRLTPLVHVGDLRPTVALPVANRLPMRCADVEGLNFAEPKFVLVVAATRPIVKLAEQFISLAARLIPVGEGVAFYVASLTLGPLPGSLITEPGRTGMGIWKMIEETFTPLAPGF